MRIASAVIATAIITATVTAGFVAMAQDRNGGPRPSMSSFSVAGIDSRDHVWLQSNAPGPTRLVVCWQAKNSEILCNIEQTVQ